MRTEQQPILVWTVSGMILIAVPLRMIRFFGTNLEAVRCVYEIDGTPLEMPVLHPVGLLALSGRYRIWN